MAALVQIEQLKAAVPAEPENTLEKLVTVRNKFNEYQTGYSRFKDDLLGLQQTVFNERNILLEKFQTKVTELEQDYKIKEHEYLA
jgi:hypothetical protein